MKRDRKRELQTLALTMPKRPSCSEPTTKKRRSVAEDGQENANSITVSDNPDATRANSCPPHPGYLYGLCIRCGSLKSYAEEEPHVALRYIHAGLEVSSEEAQRIRSTELQQMLLRKKLSLVLDIDHTLVNSVSPFDISSDEIEHLSAVYMSNEDTIPEFHKESGIHMLEDLQLWTKLRPFMHDFLKEASKLFELHLYTMGTTSYAQTVARILDPSGHLFGNRVISQGESTSRTTKDLDVLLSTESAVLILDDTEAVWPRHKDNLILIERYHFFGSSHRQYMMQGASLLEAGKDESEDDGTLANTLKLLRQVHTAFFDGYYQDGEEDQTYNGEKDVRQILQAIRSRVLVGCRVVFSRIFPTDLASPETHPLWQLVECLGATCSISVDDGVTHVVALDKGTLKGIWAQEQNRHLVHPRWVDAAFHTWRRP